MGKREVATGVFGSLVAASAAAGLLAGCAASPQGIGGAATSDPPQEASRPAAASPQGIGGAATSDPPQEASRPAAAAPPVAVPDIPRQSTALEDQPVAPPAPTRLEVPSLGIDVAVQPAGLDGDGRMGLFDDPAIAAWYRFGPAPASDAGSTVIAAHVDSLVYDVLPFARLRDAAPGTEVIVTDAAGTRHAYAVQSLQVIEKADVDWDAAFDRSGAPRLTLVTCGGAFDYEQRRYLSNLVVTAAPVG